MRPQKVDIVRAVVTAWWYMAAKALQSSVLHPLVNAPAPDVIEVEASPGLGRGDRCLREGRASGGLPDDPTTSGEPVRNRKSFSALKGGR